MGFVLRTVAIFIVAAKRLLSQQGLVLAIVLGLIAAVALVMSIPLYADAVYYRTLQEELTATGPDATVKRPAFAFMFRYIGSTYEPKELDEIHAVDTYLSGPAAADLGLPHQMTVRYFKTDNFRLFPLSDQAYSDSQDPLEWVNFGFASGFDEQIRLLEGSLPAVADSDPHSAVEVLVHEDLALQLGLQVGEEFVTFRRARLDDGVDISQIPVRIAGVWQATDPTNPYWFYSVSSLRKVLMVPELTLSSRLAPSLRQEMVLALWYLVMDGSDVSASDVGWIVARANQVQQQVSALLSNTKLDISPLDALRRYQRSSQVLTVLLYAFSVPIVGLLLAFIGLVVGLAVSRQRNEIAVLRSRGATVSQILGIASLEALLLGSLALVVGLPVSRWIAEMIGATRSFLDFSASSDLRLNITENTLQFGLIAVGVTLAAQVLPTFGAARFTIVTYKQEEARSLRLPWWQRAWLDMLLLIPTGYGVYLLRQQGSIALPGSSASGEIFQNPLLFLVPALGIFALTLLMLRILPTLMAVVAWLAAKTNSVGLLLAARHLSRSRGLYTAPLILLVLTLSLSAFTTSLAQTLDNHLYDQIYYNLGSDVRLRELGMNTGTSSGVGMGTTEGAASAESSWIFVPVSEHLRVPAIQAAARFADYEGRIQVQGNWRDAAFFGIDRVDFPKVAYWRHDFSPSTLGALMNALAVAYDGVLLPQEFMRQHSIQVGDTVQVLMSKYSSRVQMSMQVVGSFDYFPTWYPDEGPLLVGNLDFIFDQLGGQYPYDVWTRTVPDIDYAQMVRELRALDLNVLDWTAARLRIGAEQRRPERQGLFGVLSVGFLAAALLTVLGFLLYTLFSFRRRFIELGTLRAIGLSAGQMTTFLAWELAFLIGVGVGAGTALGALVSNVFIPYLQVGTSAAALTPPFLVEIAWPAIFRIYLLFGLVFVLALIALVFMLLRMKIFQAIKLGETV